MWVPVEFVLFGLMLLAVVLFHKRALVISLVGLFVILTYETFVSTFPTGTGAGALLVHLAHEWVTLTNLLLLLVGFEMLASHFEHSNISDHLPCHLPTGWAGSLA